MKSLAGMAVVCLVAGGGLALLPNAAAAQRAPAATAQKPARPAAQRPAARPNLRQIEAELRARNAALVGNGGRISLLQMGAGRDQRTRPEDAIDGNAHSRPVLWNPPYAFRIELVDKLPITQINFILDDYPSEAWPKDLEITLSDGTKLTKTLELQRPIKNQPLPRQSVSINKELSWFEVKIVNYVMSPSADGKTINYGGMGEIEAITSADLSKFLQVPDSNPQAPVYIEGGSPASDYRNVKVNMPAPIPPGQHPCLFLTRDEILQLRQDMQKTERGQKTLQAVLDTAAPWLERTIEHPDPKLPAQLKDRSDAQAKAHSALCSAAGRLGWAYQLTDDERYAAKARQILVGYARLYPNDYQEHKGVNGSDTSKIMAQRLSEAMIMLPLIQAYDMIYNARCMTAADRTLIENDLFRPALTFLNSKRPAAEDVKNRDARNPDWRTADPGPGKAVGNWTNFYNAAYIQAGLVMGDRNWVDIGIAETRLMIARGIGDDGMWKEGAIGYQFFARMALVACMEPLARHGIDLYSFSNCRVKNLWDSAFKYAYPDGTAPGIHDSGRVKIGGDWQAMAYDYGWLRYGDPNYGAAVNNAPRQLIQSDAVYFPTQIYRPLPEQPLQGVGSLYFNTLGYAILRGTDGGSPTFLLMDVGPNSGPHDHPDKLNLLIYADGDELAGEPGFYRYEDPRHGEWTLPTVAHFTLAVDQNSQMHTSGKLLAFHDAGAVKVMRGVCDSAYPGVGLDRTVVQMPGYIVDVFRAHSANQHTYDYPLCFRGQVDVLKGVDSASLKALADNRPGYKHLQALAPQTTSNPWTATWVRPANQVKVTVLGAPETQIIAGRDVDERDRVLIRRRGRTAVFASIIDPYKAVDVVKSVEPLEVTGSVGGYGLKVTRLDGGTDLILVRFDPQADNTLAGPSSFPGGRTDALVSVVRLDAAGKPIECGFVGGTTLTCGGKTLARSAPGIQWEK